MSFRVTAFEILNHWQKNKAYINKQLLAYYRGRESDKQNMSACSNLCLGVVERKIELDYLISQLSKTKIKKIEPRVLIILEMGLYQLKYMNYKPYAVCNEMTGLVKKIGLHGLSGYVNAVLRAYLRRADEILYPDEEANIRAYLHIKYSMPQWLCRHFIKEIGIINTKRAFEYFMNDRSVTVRVVQSLINVEDVIRLFHDYHIEYEKNEYLDYVFYIKNMPVLLQTDMLKKGYLQVQNLSSVLVGEVAKSRLAPKVLDICAAPGGKSLHLADLMKLGAKTNDELKKGEIIARDIHESGIRMLEERRQDSGFLNIRAELKDASVFYPEDEEGYDLILADLPCSGLGVIARKPDIKYYSSSDGIQDLATLQFFILKNAVRYLKKGGSLIYSTCTVSKLENSDISDRIVEELGLEKLDISASFPEKIREALKENWRIDILPGEFGSDGFFISGFYKR